MMYGEEAHMAEVNFTFIRRSMKYKNLIVPISLTLLLHSLLLATLMNQEGRITIIYLRLMKTDFIGVSFLKMFKSKNGSLLKMPKRIF
jgi:hypothetical protein